MARVKQILIVQTQEAAISDVILELDFCSVDIIQPGPALNGQFKVDLVSRYIDGSRPSMPRHWESSNLPIKEMMNTLARLTKKQPQSGMMIIVRHANAYASLGYLPPYKKWSQEALDFFPLGGSGLVDPMAWEDDLPREEGQEMHDYLAGLEGLMSAVPKEGEARDDSHNFFRLMRFIEASKEIEDFYFHEYVNGIERLLSDIFQGSPNT